MITTPLNGWAIRFGGSITEVDVTGRNFTLHTLRGEDLTFTTNANTIFEGGVTTLQDLQTGMRAAVGAFQQMDGSRLALVVVARRPLIRHAGEVTSVDAAGGWFELKTRKGEFAQVRRHRNHPVSQPGWGD